MIKSPQISSPHKATCNSTNSKKTLKYLVRWCSQMRISDRYSWGSYTARTPHMGDWIISVSSPLSRITLSTKSPALSPSLGACTFQIYRLMIVHSLIPRWGCSREGCVCDASISGIFGKTRWCEQRKPMRLSTKNRMLCIGKSVWSMISWLVPILCVSITSFDKKAQHSEAKSSEAQTERD